MATTNMFEFASRNKIRFQSARGELSVEQIWDVPLRSKDGFDLNAVAKSANEALKGANEENFVDVTQEKTKAHVRLEVAFEIVKHIIDSKQSDENAAKKRVENKAEKEKLLAILAEKQDGKLSDLTERELRRRIAALDTE